MVRDATTKKCTIVDKKPTTTTTIVDNGVFKTRTSQTLDGPRRKTYLLDPVELPSAGFLFCSDPVG